MAKTCILGGTNGDFPSFQPKSKGNSKASEDVQRVLAALNSALRRRTFLVGERLTLAEAALLPEVLPLVRDPSCRCDSRRFPHLLRWVNTCTHQPRFRSVLGEIGLLS